MILDQCNLVKIKTLTITLKFCLSWGKEHLEKSTYRSMQLYRTSRLDHTLWSLWCIRFSSHTHQNIHSPACHSAWTTCYHFWLWPSQILACHRMLRNNETVISFLILSSGQFHWVLSQGKVLHQLVCTNH